jgi:hypothetical protein
MKILLNKVRCNLCNDEIESKFTHDFKWCSCGNVAVDGGKEYLKRSYKNKDAYTELSIESE